METVPKKSILINSSFIYHVKNGEIILAWFTTRAIFRFFQMISGLVLLFYIYKSKRCNRRSQNILLWSSAFGHCIMSIILYGGHLTETNLNDCLEVLFNLTVIAAMVSSAATIALSDKEDKAVNLALLIFVVLLNILELVVLWNVGNVGNFLYRYIREKKRQNKSKLIKSNKKKTVKFSVDNIVFTPRDSISETSLNSELDNDDGGVAKGSKSNEK